MSVEKVVWEQRIGEIIEAIKPMKELGASNRRMAGGLNRLGLFTLQQKCPWDANSVDRFCTNHAKKLILDDGENLFQSKKRSSEIEDFFPYPNYGPFS